MRRRQQRKFPGSARMAHARGKQAEHPERVAGQSCTLKQDACLRCRGSERGVCFNACAL